MGSESISLKHNVERKQLNSTLTPFSVGFALNDVQAGEKPKNAKPLHGFGGAGVLEIIEDFDGDTYRAVYTVKFRSAIYVLHCLPKPDELFLRAGLLRAVRDVMRKSGLTQEQLAEKTGLKQPDVSRILNGGERGFSTDRLARIAFKLGYLPTVDLRPMPRAEKARPTAKASGKAA